MRDSSPRRVLKIALACGFALWLQTAGAVPVSIGGVVSGSQGDPVSPTLIDTVVDLEAADIRLTFDPVFLSFVDAVAGTVTAGFSVVAGAPTPAGSLMEVLVSLATGISPVTDTGSILAAFFQISNTAPLGITFVDFETLDAALYDFPATSAQITVVGPSGVPIGNSFILLLAGLVAVVGFQRRPARE